MTEKRKRGRPRKKRKTTVEEVRAEIFDNNQMAVEVVTDPGHEADAIKQQIKNTLAVADERYAEMELPSNLEKMWDEVTKFTDTNEIVRLNLQQIQVMFQEQFDKYYRRKSDHDRMLQEVLAKGDDYATEYVEMERTFKQEQEDDLKIIMNLSQRVEGMAKEYRQCALQKKWVVHIALVVQFKLAVESAIHRNVSDPRVLTAISDDIRRAAVELFKTMPEENA